MDPPSQELFHPVPPINAMIVLCPLPLTRKIRCFILLKAQRKLCSTIHKSVEDRAPDPASTNGDLLKVLLFRGAFVNKRVKKYRGMGSLEAMTRGSDQRYLGDTAKLKIAQGVVGLVEDKGSVLKLIPYTMQAVKQGFQDLGASFVQSAHDLLRSGVLRLEARTGAAQVEGGIHGLVSYDKKSY